MSTQALADALRMRGISPTQQRLAVYRYLLEHRTHPTADTVYQALVAEYPTMSRTTVYNTMRALFRAGLIRIVTIDADEQHFDADTADHGHFRCTQCGELYDFTLPQSTCKRLSPSGFHTDVFDVYATGLCPHCQSTN
jgi:Fe2+ or Zn2+ uptake regulation protein